MNTSKSFELITLVSLMNKREYLETTKKEVKELIEHVHGSIQESETLAQVKDQVIDYLAENHPRVVEAAAMLVNSIDLDKGRYGSLMNLCGKFHDIRPMPVPQEA